MSRITDKQQDLNRLIAKRDEYLLWLKQKKIIKDVNIVKERALIPLARKVAEKMGNVIKSQKALIEYNVKLETAKVKNSKEIAKQKKLETDFFKAFELYRDEFNKAHIEAYYSFSQKVFMIGNLTEGYEKPKYSRDDLDIEISLLANEIKLEKVEELFYTTILKLTHCKQDFTFTYLDCKEYAKKHGENKKYRYISNIEILAVNIKDIISNNENVITIFREPLQGKEKESAEEQVKLAILEEREDQIIEDEEIIKKKEYNNTLLKLEKTGYQLVTLQTNIIEKQNEIDICHNCGMQVSPSLKKEYEKLTATYLNVMDNLQKKMKKVQFHTGLEVKDCYKQLKEIAVNRLKVTAGIDMPIISIDDFEKTYDSIKGINADKKDIDGVKHTEEKVEAEDKEKSAEDKNIFREQSNIILDIFLAEKQKNKRELSPDPKKKEGN